MRTSEIAEIIRIQEGSHPTPQDGMCALEMVAFMAHEEHSDHPRCASVVIAAFVRQWNDDLDDATRQRLAPYLVRIVGTAGTAEQEAQRMEMIWQWVLRVNLPTWLRAGGLDDAAADVEQHGEAALTAARDAARDAAWVAARVAAQTAAGDAAWVAAWDAAGDAARNAAWATVWVAAWDAARDAAGDAARNAAGDAAWDAARDALAPTVAALQESAFDLLDRLIRVTETPTVTAAPERVERLRELGVPV